MRLIQVQHLYHVVAVSYTHLDVYKRQPSGYGISGSVGIFALNLIIGGLIGGLAFFIGLLLGVIHTCLLYTS